MPAWMESWTTVSDWFVRANALVPARDRKVLLSPPRLVARFARFALARHRGDAARAGADEISARDPALLELGFDLLHVLARYYFRLRVEGIEEVPAGPVLFVGNHSGGLVPLEGFFLSMAIRERFGIEREVYALAHDFLFEDPVLRRYAGRMGMLRAGHTSAHHAFAAGGSVIVFPGSDLDTFRPFRDRAKIVLGGRKGFLRLALRAGVPIVPFVTAGTHEQFIVLARGDRIAKLVHAHEWARTEVLPLVLSLPWGLTSGFVPYLPLPAQTTVAVLPAMRWSDRDPDDPDAVARCYAEVEAAMQHGLDELTRGRQFLRGQRPAPAPTPRRGILAAPG
jgi:1-acyl-sn-glycerol-3-phosphate acyltransferase